MFRGVVADYVQTEANTRLANARRPTTDEALHFSDAPAAEAAAFHQRLRSWQLVWRQLICLAGRDTGGGIYDTSVANEARRTRNQCSDL